MSAIALSASFLCTLLMLGTTARPSAAKQDGTALSEATEMCLMCHEGLHPGIVADWRNSRHASTTVAEALATQELARRVSAERVPEDLLEVAVGCAECHTLNPETHPDTVTHGDAEMHLVVTPSDCAVCHPVEADEYQQNIMSQAYHNLVSNELFSDLVRQVNGVQTWQAGELATAAPHALTDQDACLSCHGTEVTVEGTESRSTALGEMTFAVLSGWPNQGVGRINPDGSRGSCSACHARHEFSIRVARKPYTCAQCHKGPDVPAYPVYLVSKHGNLQASSDSDWDYDAVPWKPGADFTAPTCATCHASLLANTDGIVLAPRTHRMNDRLFTRLFGLPYAHAHPKSPVTHTIRNAAGLPLPVELTGEPVSDALIDAEEQAARKRAMQAVCRSCHASSWIEGHFERLDHTIDTTNEMTLAATQVLLEGWERGVADGPAAGDSVFDDPLERMWVEQWLFYANSTRFASAMSGADYGVFANGRFFLAKNLREMAALLELSSGD
jgi:hypothetical protein